MQPNIRQTNILLNLKKCVTKHFSSKVWQFLLAAIAFLFILNPLDASAIKLEQLHSKKIIDFTLHNFDNIVADTFEEPSDYINQLAYLISTATALPKAEIHTFIQNINITKDDSPPSYLLKLNKYLKDKKGFYFIDD